METTEHIFGRDVVVKALLYANHEWYATEKNVMHGMDEYVGICRQELK